MCTLTYQDGDDEVSRVLCFVALTLDMIPKDDLIGVEYTGRDEDSASPEVYKYIIYICSRIYYSSIFNR